MKSPPCPGNLGPKYHSSAPQALADDDTPDLPVFQHCLQWLYDHEGYRPEIVVHLRPTSPLRLAEHI